MTALTRKQVEAMLAGATPGPWHTRQSISPHDGQYDFAINATKAKVLSEAFGRDSKGNIIAAEANAHLIAAAPDLAAALLAAWDREAKLREALTDAEETLRLMEHPRGPDPSFHEVVKDLGERIGFGALMSTAEAGWREYLEENGLPGGGGFVAGPCRGTVDSTLKRIRAALKGETP
jgi:ABC-type nitrate/sulfonate/bicarbonate transport system substrate-binding protein